MVGAGGVRWRQSRESAAARSIRLSSAGVNDIPAQEAGQIVADLAQRGSSYSEANR